MLRKYNNFYNKKAVQMIPAIEETNILINEIIAYTYREKPLGKKLIGNLRNL